MWSVHARIQQSLSVSSNSLALATAAGSRRTFRAGHTAHDRHMQSIEKLDLGRSRQELGMGMFRLRSFSFGWIQFSLDITTLGVYGSWLKRNCLEGSPTTRHAVGILCGRDFKCSLEVEPIGPGDGWAWRERVASERNHFIHIPNGCLRLRFVFSLQLFIVICFLEQI